MRINRYLLSLAVISSLLSHAVVAQSLLSYRQLKPMQDESRQLRASPMQLSRFPTTFSIALTADRKHMRTVDINGKVWQWSLDRLAKPSLATELNCEPACAVLSQNARWLAFAEPGGSVVVWDFDTEQIHFRDDTATERTVTLKFSPNSKLLAAVTVGGNVRMWDAGSRTLRGEWSIQRSPVQTAAFSPDCTELAMASFSPVVTLYDLRLERSPQGTFEGRTIQAGNGRVTAFAYSPDGKQLVIASSDGAIDVFDRSTGKKAIELGTHPFAIWSLEFQLGGRSLAAGSWDGTVRIWNAATWQLSQLLKGHDESVTSLVYDLQRGLVSAGLDGRLLYYSPDVPSIKPLGVISGRPESVWIATYSPKGEKLFVGGRDKRFELWDTTTMSLTVSRDGHPTTRCAAFSPNGTTVATGGDDGLIFLCDSASGATEQTLRRHRGAVSAVLFADEGQTLVSVCDGKEVKLWDAVTGAEKVTWREHQEQVYCAALSPDGRCLVTGGGNWTTGDPGELIVWEFPSGRVRARIEGHKLAVWSIVFTRDGTRFASSDSSGAVLVWNLETLEQEHVLQHSTWVRALAISPDGTTLAVGRGDGSVRLWDTKAWTEKAACDGQSSFAFALEFAPDGKTLVSSGNDGSVSFWDVDLAD